MKQEITIPRKETKQERAARMLDALIFGEDEKPQPPQETEQENHQNDRRDFGKHARWWLSFVDGVNGDFGQGDGGTGKAN